MVRGAVSALALALAWACFARASVLVPTYVLPPESFLREQRSLGTPSDIDIAESQRTIKRLVGGHMKHKSEKEYGDARNSLSYDDKTKREKFVGVIIPELTGSTVGWNQGIWDDGMLMSSAGEGKDAAKTKEVDEDKKTLSDQVAEGKYGLIQNEIFSKNPKRPGIVSYEPNPETRSKDNIQTLGGLKKDEIWLAEDHLLVLKGGSFPERTKETENNPWPPIDNYEAPRRQVKLPQKPKVPPPFPVQLTDNGPLVFLTPNGSVPAAFFPPYPAGESESSLPPSPFPFPPGASYTPSENSGNTSSGGTSLPIPPFPFLPGNASEGAFPYPPPMNGSFPEGFPPGAAFLPPPSNQSDLYDEDDPSIYYPPPYNFSYHADNNNSVPAGPLVPGIILPPPPDFFAPLEEKTTSTEKITTTTRSQTVSTHSRPKTTIRRPSPTPSLRSKYKTRPTTTETITTEAPITTTATIESVPVRPRKPQRVQVPSRAPIEKELPEEIFTTPKTEKPVYKTRTRLTSKPLSVFVIDEYPDQIYDSKSSKPAEKPYVVYRVPENRPNAIAADPISSTPVPLRAFYSIAQNDVPTTKLEPVYNGRPNDNAVTSFYFYEEQPKSSPSPATYFDGRNYYKTVPSSPAPAPQQNLKANPQTGYNPTIDVTYGAVDQADSLYLWPQKQGPRTLTQEYFSIQPNQKPHQPVYVQEQPKQRPDTFYQQVRDIQQTIELFTTKRPKTHSRRPHHQKQKIVASRPVYEFSYQSKQRPEQFTFRAPKLDPEPFRPMVSYSKPFNVENEFNAIAPSASPGYQQYLVENVQVTTEIPTSTRYYPKTKPRDDDYDTPTKKDVRTKPNLNLIPIQDEKPIAVQHANSVPHTTPNPISHGYYTKQDEKFFDDITKNSFDIFGKKIEDSTHDVNGLAVTHPFETVRTPIDNGINLEYAYEILEPQNPNPPSLDRDTLVNDRLPHPAVNSDSEPIPPQINPNAELVELQNPPSLADDTLVNDRIPRPPINPDSEFIPIANPGFRQAQRYRSQDQVQRPNFAGEQYDLNRPSLADDTAVNFKRPLAQINADAEWITPVNAAGEGRPGSFVSYRLPGEGAHVYFLTPQASQATRERYRAPGYRR